MKLKVKWLAAAVLAALAGASQAGIVSITASNALNGDRSTNLLSNGSFETGAAGNQRWAGAAGQALGGTPNGNGASVAVNGWTTTYDTGAYGWWGPLGFGGAPCADGRNCLYFGNSFATKNSAATFGANGVVTFSGTPGLTGSRGTNLQPVVLSQTLGGLTVGGTYTLDFWVSGESNTGGFDGAGIFGLGIGDEDVYLTAVGTALNPGGLTGASARYFVTFTADSVSEKISFTNWGHACNSCTELILDDVIVNGAASSVPEPGTLALVGAAALGLAGIRRRRA